MSRALPPALAAAIEEPVVRPFLAFRIELPDPVLVFTGIGTLTFNDSDGATRVWLGAGEVGSFEEIGENGDGSATGIKVTLLKVPAELAPDIADQGEKGALFEVYIGVLNETLQTVEAVQLLQKFRLDQYKVIDAGETLSVEVSGESRAIDQRRPAIKRFTDEYQQRKYPGDRFFEYVARMAEVPILWARADQAGGGSGSSNGGAGGAREPRPVTNYL